MHLRNAAVAIRVFAIVAFAQHTLNASSSYLNCGGASIHGDASGNAQIPSTNISCPQFAPPAGQNLVDIKLFFQNDYSLGSAIGGTNSWTFTWTKVPAAFGLTSYSDTVSGGANSTTWTPSGTAYYQVGIDKTSFASFIGGGSVQVATVASANNSGALVPINGHLDANVFIQYDYGPAGGAASGPVTYSSNTSLTGDVSCTDLTIESGVTLITNGFNIYCAGTLTNNGVIQTGFVSNGGTGANESPTGATGGGVFSNSYGGSGGGGGGSAAITLGSAQISGSGGPTLVPGGSGGTNVGGSCGTGGAGTSGTTPSAPSVTVFLVQSWSSQTILPFLAGGGGAGGAGSGNLCRVPLPKVQLAFGGQR